MEPGIIYTRYDVDGMATFVMGTPRYLVEAAPGDRGGHIVYRKLWFGGLVFDVFTSFSRLDEVIRFLGNRSTDYEIPV
jgi:hypothetical protein